MNPIRLFSICLLFSLCYSFLWAGPKLKATLIKEYGFEIKIPQNWEKSKVATPKEYDVDIYFKGKGVSEEALTFFIFFKISSSIATEARNFDEYLDERSENERAIAKIIEREEIEWAKGQNQKAQIYKYYYPDSEKKDRHYLACSYRVRKEKQDYNEYVVIYSNSSLSALEKDERVYKKSFKSFRLPRKSLISQKETRQKKEKKVLPKGWNLSNTNKHYKIEYQFKKKKKALKEIETHLKLIRKECDKEFSRYKKGSTEKNKKLFKTKIKIFSKKGEFESYLTSYLGANTKDSPSHYHLARDNPEKDELILLREPSKPKELFGSLYREVSNHYICSFFDRTFPDSWFIAGFGEYYWGMTLKGGIPKLKSRQDIRKVIQENALYSFKELVFFSTDDFTQKNLVTYPQSAILIYFLKKKRKKILKDYIKTFLETKDINKTRNKVFGNPRSMEILNKEFRKFIDKHF